MTPFRQQIRRGDVGLDVLAVKRVLRKRGFGGLAMTAKAGSIFVHDLARLQKAHGLAADGVYGKRTHALVAPFFDGWGVRLYTHARIRKQHPPVPATAQAAAKVLLAHHRAGRYRADNPGDLRDVEATAAGKAVWSRGGYWVHIDARVMQALCYLIGHGHRIGTFAICSDHHDDGPHGHAGGKAFDVSSIDGVSVADSSARSKVIAIDELLRAGGHLRPRQLISGGYGNRRDAVCSSLSVPGGDWYYGRGTMGEHCNHIHAGF